jgi:hypothetical protein
MTTLVLAAVALATVRRDPKIVAAIIVTVCAVLVKETAVVTPLLVALVLVARSGERLDRSEWTTVGSLLAVIGGYLIVRLIVGVPATFLAVDDWRYLIKQLLAGSFATVGAPWTDTWWRTHVPLALLRALTIVALLTAGIHRWGRRDPRFRQAVAAALWVVAGAAPAFSLFFVGPNLEGARYVYLSAAGFSILLAVFAGTAAELIVRRERHRRFALTAIAAIVAGSAAPAILADLERWQRAASTRDAVLNVVRSEAGRLNCTTFTPEGPADSSEGAYVFRNGLKEALDQRESTPSVPCRVAGAEGKIVVLPE